MKIWLIGGFIGGVIGVVLALLFGVVVPSFFIPNFNNGVPSSSMYYLWIISFLFYFIIGAIIGWIIGKIKRK